jgi:hypothetical protein
MRIAALLLLAAAAGAAAAVREPECPITARRMLSDVQITAMVRPGYKFASNRINLFQSGGQTPLRPVSVSTREVTFMVPPKQAASFVVTLHMTDRNRARVWVTHLRGTGPTGKKEDCSVQLAEKGPQIPEDGLVQNPPTMLPYPTDSRELKAALGPKGGAKPATVAAPQAAPAAVEKPEEPAAGEKDEADGKDEADEKVEAKAEETPVAAPVAAPSAAPAAAPAAAPVDTRSTPTNQQPRTDAGRKLLERIRSKR